jgi:hypothetical protein
MPLLKAQKHKLMFDPPPAGIYHFDEIHRIGWSEFWHEMKGDLDKVVDWAKKAEIEEPEAWVNELYKFLFGTYSGNMKLYVRGAKSNFSTFLAQTAANHINDPKDKWWYINRGITHQKFIGVMERAADISEIRNAIYFVNARIPDLGFKLYDEYLLSQAGHLDDMKRVASGMRKKAYEIEKGICGDAVLPEKDDMIIHADFPGEEFKVLEMIDDVIVVEDADGKDCYIADPWNIG